MKSRKLALILLTVFHGKHLQILSVSYLGSAGLYGTQAHQNDCQRLCEAGDVDPHQSLAEPSTKGINYVPGNEACF